MFCQTLVLQDSQWKKDLLVKYIWEMMLRWTKCSKYSLPLPVVSLIASTLYILLCWIQKEPYVLPWPIRCEQEWCDSFVSFKNQLGICQLPFPSAKRPACSYTEAAQRRSSIKTMHSRATLDPHLWAKDQSSLL